MSCPLCGCIESKFADNYLFNVKYDKKYFGEPTIEVCAECNLGYVSPMPSSAKLQDYYTNIYRSSGRPHFENQKSPPMPRYRHLGCMSNLSSMVDLSKVSTILEIGAGWGEMGKLLLEYYPNINIYAVEPDKHCQSVLMKRGYKVVESFKDIKGCNAEVVISLHCLEHFSSPMDFVDIYKPYISPNATILLEVPNCRFGEGYEQRTYDSPHLLFFNSESMDKFAELNNLKVVTMFTTGWDTKESFVGMSNWKREYGNWLPGNVKRRTIKDVIKSITPVRIKNSIRALIGETSIKIPAHQSRNFSKDNPNLNSLRCILKVKN
jgi:2-polyprenyl-3-methyl-5-hydroxy-6-metoxy-1,4-benzoquinol methylase